MLIVVVLVLNVAVLVAILKFVKDVNKRMGMIETTVVSAVLEENSAELTRAVQDRLAIIGIARIAIFSSTCFLITGLLWKHVSVGLAAMMIVASIILSVGVFFITTIQFKLDGK